MFDYVYVYVWVNWARVCVNVCVFMIVCLWVCTSEYVCVVLAVACEG